MFEIKPSHLDKMRHAVGFFADEPGYRNYYCSDTKDHDWRELVDMGLAIEGAASGSQSYFAVSEKGKALIGLEHQRHYAQSWKNRMADMQEYCEQELSGE